jgi:cysteine desulfurase / selenocysteine lyase
MHNTLDTHIVKKDFPIFNRTIQGKSLVYLDNAATSQKPKAVLDALYDYYANHNANVHRGIHTLSEEATNLYEQARHQVAKFINSPTHSEVIFTKGTTESLNFICATLGENIVHEGDSILVTEIEHHSNFVPWQMLAQRNKAKLEIIEVDDQGHVDFDDFERKMHKRVKIVALTHASNVLGTIFPVKRIAKEAHKFGAVVVVDGAQAIPHLSVDVQSLDCDVYAFSAHKMLGPTGIGVLWAKRSVLEHLQPYQYGGGMIESVSIAKSTWADIPERFEAGTPIIAGAIGLGAAAEYLQAIGMDKIKAHEEQMNAYTLGKLKSIDGLRILGSDSPTDRTGLVAFTIKNLHPHDIASILNTEGVAVRSGHHCAHPLHQKMAITASVRASYYLYNSTADIDTLVEGIAKAQKILGAKS